MLIQNFQDLLFKTVSLTAAIWASEKTNLLSRIFSPQDSQEVMAIKMSAFLSASEYVGDMALSRIIGKTTPTLYNTFTSFGYAFLSNSLVLYTFDKLSLDEKIITSNNDEMKAVQMAVLFVLVQEVSHYILSYLMKGYY